MGLTKELIISAAIVLVPIILIIISALVFHFNIDEFPTKNAQAIVIVDLVFMSLITIGLSTAFIFRSFQLLYADKDAKKFHDELQSERKKNR